MRTSRLLRATASVAVLILSVAAQSDSASVESAATERCALTGRVLLRSGAPAAGAVVVTSAGGQVATKNDGSFELVIDVPRGAESVQLTAVMGSNLVATAHVASFSPSGITDTGTLVLTATTSCEPNWLPTFGSALGVGGGVNAWAVFDDGSGPALYAGGGFTTVGGVAANYIAKWNGTTWAPLGSGIAGFVYALAAFDDGSGPALFAGGLFTTAGGIAANDLAKWDGTTWSSIGDSLGPVHSLTVFDDGSGPALYVGGWLSSVGGVAANNIAKWNGASWSPLGSGTNGPVEALAVFDDGSGPALCAGGSFNFAGASVGNIAKWNGATWSPLASGVNSTIKSLVVFDDGSGPALYAGGYFTAAGGMTANHIAKWNGTTWSTLGTGTFDLVLSLAVLDDGSGPALYAGCLVYGGGAEGTIVKWNGTSWATVGGGVSVSVPNAPSVNALTVFDDGSGPALFVGGSFRAAGSVTTNGVARWNGATWAQLGGGTGLNASVRAWTVFDDGSGPALYAGGDFTTAGNAAASYIAKWNGASWSPLGSGLDSSVKALAVFDDGSGPALFAAGHFRVTAKHIAKWNGVSWASLGNGIDGINTYVAALAVFDDGNGPALYAAGQFNTAGGVSALRIAKWNGTSWAPLGSGIGGFVGDTVRALQVFDDGSGPALYAAGEFTTAGNMPALYTAKWNGTSWTPLGSGMNNYVHALGVFDDGTGPALCAGGKFTTAGGVTANCIAKWNGTSWAPLGGGMSGTILPGLPSVDALASFDDGSGPALYAAGYFTTAEGLAANNIAKWDGTSWSTLGSGLSSSGTALTAFDDGTGNALFVGGLFALSSAGDSFAAKWGCALPAGARTYGASSPGCTGALAMGVTSSPTVGNAAFAMTCSNTPASAPGAFFAGTAFISPLPILGIQIWVNPIVSLGIASSASGTTAIPLPLPPNPMIAGVQFDVQTIWLGPTSPPPCRANGLSATNALELTIQP